MEKLAIVQPLIPSYREEFFKKLSDNFKTDLYIYQDASVVQTYKLRTADLLVKNIGSISINSILIYNPFKLMKGNYSILVLMLHFGHVTTWILLITKFIHRKKIILWGHAISVKRYEKEKYKPDFKLKLMIYFSDCVWCYTEDEKNIWKHIFPNKDIISLNNTISGVRTIINKPNKDRSSLRKKYNIYQPIIFIYCARFNIAERRIDLLLDIIRNLDPKKFGFIIIGDGIIKPKFSCYENVYDFGALFNYETKDELFQIADIYFQPAWVGLSIVEAMANGKPIYTFERSATILQCVEYNFIINNYNGRIFKSIQEFIDEVSKLPNDSLKVLGANSKTYVTNHLTMDNMVLNAYNSLLNLIQ